MTLGQACLTRRRNRDTRNSGIAFGRRKPLFFFAISGAFKCLFNLLTDRYAMELYKRIRRWNSCGHWALAATTAVCIRQRWIHSKTEHCKLQAENIKHDTLAIIHIAHVHHDRIKSGRKTHFTTTTTEKEEKVWKKKKKFKKKKKKKKF